MVIVIGVDVTGLPVKQGVALEVIVQVIMSPVTNAALEYVVALVPTVVPFNFHTQTGPAPGFIGAAVKVTGPAQAGFDDADTLTLAGKMGFTVTVD